MLRTLLLLLIIRFAMAATSSSSASSSLGEGFQSHHIPLTTSRANGNEDASSSQLYVRKSRQAAEQVVNDAKVGAMCSTHDPTDEERLLMAQAQQTWTSNPNRRRLQQEIIEIPVYMHMLLATNAPTLTQMQLKKYVNTLNRGFKSSPFQFVLYQSDITYNNTYATCQEETAFKSETRSKVAQDGPDVLHLWICDTNANSPGSVGYSYFPPITQSSFKDLDGVVIMTPNNQVFGPDAIYQAVIHEVGHWLGLLHTFEGGCNAVGDGVRDTPAHSGPTYGQPIGMESCWQNLNPKLNTCPDTPENEAAGMDLGDDPVDNYMNYLPQNCYTDYGRFTPGQVERMVSQYQAFRYRNVTTATASPSVNVATEMQQQQKSGPCAATQSSTGGSCVTHTDCCGNQKCITRANKRNVFVSKCQKCRKRRQVCQASDECCGSLTCQSGKCRI
ncbi:hypothetical protein MPSEU_000771300 [Mayamaea pseudoterrestris]|nr:hypothetical protein MPSEU_000771300 [Mayamaea pseudoterrestris]